MKTSIVTETLTDGSKQFNVVFVDGSNKAVIAANSEAAAYRIEAVLLDDAAYVTIDPL